MSRELPADSPHAEDLGVLISQSDRCRDILTRLTVSPEDESGSPFYRAPLMTLVESAARAHRREGASLDVEIDPANEPKRSFMGSLVCGAGASRSLSVGGRIKPPGARRVRIEGVEEIDMDQC